MISSSNAGRAPRWSAARITSKYAFDFSPGNSPHHLQGRAGAGEDVRLADVGDAAEHGELRIPPGGNLVIDDRHRRRREDHRPEEVAASQINVLPHHLAMVSLTVTASTRGTDGGIEAPRRTAATRSSAIGVELQLDDTACATLPLASANTTASALRSAGMSSLTAAKTGWNAFQAILR